ncbi:DUF3152 domain-containing protein [Knoellia locipacati]|uniref:DUF3152 domain-containing protein n=1 Tax=Knoellia locipacati TaxID=882824 RepID=UPI00384C5461
MPEDIDLPDWVSEPGSATRQDDAQTTRRADVRRADLRRAAEEQRRAAARRASEAPIRRDTHAVGQPPPRRASHADAREPAPLTRADRRRLEHEAQRRRHAVRADRVVEMVPPASTDVPLRSQRRAQDPRARHVASPAFARRRLLAALTLTSVLVMVLWTVWPSGESSSPGRQTADLTAAAGARAPSDPLAAAEEMPPSPTIAPTPGRATVPRSGSGKLVGVALPTIAPPTVNPNRTIRVGLQVEQGAGVDSAEAAAIVARTLGDVRGWQTKDRVRFRAVGPEAVASGDVDITLVLASPALTDSLCKPLRTNGQVSCFNLRKVVLNTLRWTTGVSGYGTDLAAYRQYMVNHEIGHGLYHGHVDCPGEDAVAPLMLQQSKGLDGCRPNAWPTRP